ncbi:hypothetical protein SAMN02910447_03525 [Ruminococcus sp. YE71]|uniref:hypothetical protein n=1 Tax=unclassified Ruminococcus TaxID=2608920 RepID=UPI00088DF6B1|nr:MULTISPECIES: hypothetical protein [unclassified Ruminococcus]SDA32461.1 hypothetical protein SAMN02910446_03596 [Ruminococcus sp. YE78]SFW53404.1 hypothetical protein SAMN02910447_03525 [Ruminococcus sp. YE71]
MGLFSKKKPAPEPAAQQPQTPARPATVNPDDIWGAPKKKASPGVESTEAMTEPVSIDPETIKKKMVALERELEEQKNKPAQSYEPISEVGGDEVVSAQTRYEEQYRIEHERFVATHQEDIDEAPPIDSEVDRRIHEIVQERDRRAEETKKVLGAIKETDADAIAKGMSELGVAKDETKDAEYQNINAVGNDEVEKGLSGLGVARDETKEPDYQNIKEVGSAEVDAMTKEFLEKYGDRRRPVEEPRTE